MNSDIYKAAGIIIRDRKLLVGRDVGKEHFISPGGTIEEGESPVQTLVRELHEELTIEVNATDLEEFGVFDAQAAGQEHRMVHMYVFIVQSWRGEIIPSSEIEEIAWVTSVNSERLKLGSIFEHQVIPLLKQKNLID